MMMLALRGWDVGGGLMRMVHDDEMHVPLALQAVRLCQ
jgi:hypothetical protein